MRLRKFVILATMLLIGMSAYADVKISGVEHEAETN